MNIYLIKARVFAGYDSYDAHVVIANNTREARELCPTGDEGDIWRRPQESKTIKIGTTNRKRKQVVLSSFNAG